MSRRGTEPGRDPALDEQLRALVRDAVSEIEPDDRLGQIRAGVSRPLARRPALLALGGAGLAAAAVVTAVAVGPGLLGPDAGRPDPPAASSPGGRESTDTSPQPTREPVATRTVAGYYLGETPAGLRLYREFRSVEAADDGPAASVRLLATAPADPDYRTAWPQGAFGDAEVGEDRITIQIADPSLAERPAGLSEAEARASVQQVVYTLQAYAQERLPVEFQVAGQPADQVLGTAVDGPVEAAPALQTLSLVNLSDPEEGQQVTGRLRVEGVANSFEATVPWELRDGSGATVEEGFFTAEGSMGTRLFPFSGTADLSGVAPGTYTFVVRTDDPSGGSEGAGAFTDTRTLVVE